MKISCIIVDDEPLALQMMESYVLRTDYLELKGKFGSAVKAAEFLKSNHVNLIFCDIQMPGLNGIDFSRTIPEDTRIIFTTAFSNYAVEGFRVNALDYLLKPFSYKDFLEASDKAKKWFDLTSPEPQERKVLIKVEHKLVSVDCDKLIFIEGMKDYAKFYIEGRDPLLSLVSLKSMEEQLPEGAFFRVHKSYIVNVSKVDHIERGYIIFKSNGADTIKSVPVSDNTREQFLSILGKR